MKTFVCPTCDHEQETPRMEEETGFVDIWCDLCSGALRVRYFRGQVIDVEDMDWRREKARTG